MTDPNPGHPDPGSHGPPDPDARRESRGLTGLRGVGALLVVLHHFALHFGHDPATAGPFARGYLGVDLFFVLSGFVMAMVYGTWFAGRTAAPAADQVRAVLVFLVRRAARLWPLHAAMLAIILGIEARHAIHVSLPSAVANLAMVQAWGISRAINIPAWSVSTEWLAYLVFPLAAPAILGRRLGPALGLALAAALLAAALAWAPPIGPGRRGLLDIYYNDSLLPASRCLAGFCLGMAAWRLGAVPTLVRQLANAWAGPAALLAILALMVAGASDLAVYALLPVAVLGVHHGRGPAWRLLAHGPLHRLGVLSYAFYLVHYTLLGWFPVGAWPLWVELAVYVAASLAAAHLLHALVEVPCRRLVRALGEAAVARALRRAGSPPLQGGPVPPLQGGPG